MKKLFDYVVLVGVITFLVVLWNCSTAQGDSRRNRTLSSPQSVIPFAELRTNKQGGHDYYVKGKRIGYSRKNTMGSYDIYVKGRMKYKGARFNGSPNTRLYGVNPSASVRTAPIAAKLNKPNRVRRRENLEEYLKNWSNQRASMNSGQVYWWEHFYPSTFRN